MAEEKTTVEGTENPSTNAEQTATTSATVDAKSTSEVVAKASNKRTVTLTVAGFKWYAKPRTVQVGNREVTKVCAIVTVAGKNNPSPTGVFELTQQQFERIAIDAVKVANPMVLGLAIDACNGQCKMAVEVEECIVGQTWHNPKTGTTGTYGFEITPNGLVRKADAKNWTNQSNHSIQLAPSVIAQFNDIAFAEAVKQSMSGIVAPVTVQKTVKQEEPEIGG